MRNDRESTLRAAVFALALLFTAASSSAFAQTSPAKSEIGFLYAFGAYVGGPGKGKVLPVQNETSLRAGDRLKLYFEPRKDQHFYLLHLSSQGELTPLFPAGGRSSAVARGTKVFLPADAGWFELDAHPGQEKFFLVAAAERLDRLEELCARHTALADKGDAQSSAEAILEEIKQLKQKHKQLSAPAEKPVRIGGSVRGDQRPGAATVPDITSLAVEVTAPGFFTRTFSIEHR
jgi:hypothetical protein